MEPGGWQEQRRHEMHEHFDMRMFLWPINIREAFQRRARGNRITDAELFALFLFFIGNGVYPPMVYRWLDVRSMQNDRRLAFQRMEMRWSRWDYVGHNYYNMQFQEWDVMDPPTEWRDL